MTTRVKRGKQASLGAALLLLAVLLGGCVAPMEERTSVDLTHVKIEAGVPAPLEDGADESETTALLYFLDEDAASLQPVVRSIAVNCGENQALAVLDALLCGPLDGEEEAFWPALGDVRSERMIEISGGIATVDLPASARMLSAQMLYAVRLAIAATLTELPEISYVNVLIGGREEGLDLGATLPVGTMTHVDDFDVQDQYNRLYDQRLSGDGVTMLTTLYFPTADGSMILPEVRSVSYAQVSPIEYLYTLLGELGKGTTHALSCHHVPAPMDFIEEMPEIVRTEDGYLAIELQFQGGLDRALREAGLTRAVYLAMLTDTLMGFVPGIEGLQVSIEGQQVTGFEAEHTPDGADVRFEESLATRGDFAGFVGAPTTLYTMEGGKLACVQRILPQALAYDPRERLLGLIALSQEEDAFALPPGIGCEDILAIHVGKEAIAVNLTDRAAKALSALSEGYERAAVYAMVNTLTEGIEAQRVVFFFDGVQRAALGGALELRGAFLRNPGMVVN